jgi:hypothetical protein
MAHYWMRTRNYGPLRAFFVHKNGWTPYHIYYFFNLDSCSYSYFWSNLHLSMNIKFSYIFSLLDILCYKFIFSFDRIEFFFYPYFNLKLISFLIYFDPLWYILDLLVSFFVMYWFIWVVLFISYILFKLPIWIGNFIIYIFLFPILVNNIIINIQMVLKEYHHKYAFISLGYRLISFYDFVDSTQKQYLYLNRIYRFKFFMFKTSESSPFIYQLLCAMILVYILHICV